MEEFYLGCIVLLLLVVIYLIKKWISLNKKIMEMSLEQNVKYLVQAVDVLTIDVKTIKRGLYGDPDNKVKGLIERQNDDEKRLDALEQIDDKQELKKKWFTGLLLGLAGILDWVLHYWDKLFGK